MKVLIWFGACFLYGLIVSGLAAGGITLGGLPTVLLLGVLFWFARKLCVIYDESKENQAGFNRETQEPIIIPSQNAPKNDDFSDAKDAASTDIIESVEAGIPMLSSTEGMIICPKCGKEQFSGRTRCRSCGCIFMTQSEYETFIVEKRSEMREAKQTETTKAEQDNSPAKEDTDGTGTDSMDSFGKDTEAVTKDLQEPMDDNTGNVEACPMVKPNSTPIVSVNGDNTAEVRFCRFCGFKLVAESSFCSRCGKPVDLPKVRCSSCGQELANDALFCHKCGTPK